MKVYIVTEPGRGWDCVLGAFSNEKYVYSKYSSSKYYIRGMKVDDTEFTPQSNNDLIKYGRTDFFYKFIEVNKVRREGNFETSVYLADGSLILTYNIVDPREGEFVIKLNGVEQEHSIEVLSLIADLFCDYTKIDKQDLVIFVKNGEGIYLGTTTKYEDSKELWDSFKKHNVELYY